MSLLVAFSYLVLNIDTMGMVRDAAALETEGIPYAAVGGNAVVRMKLTPFHDKDRTHLRDLIDVGLIDASWTAKFSAELAVRLRQLLDTPDG